MEKLKLSHHSRKFAVFVICLAVALIVLHAFFNNSVHIDNTTVLLLIVILLVPYLPWVTRIKYGNFEAEIGREEIKQIEQKLDATTAQPSDEPHKEDGLEAIRDLSKTDPTFALLKVRIAIEERLRALVNIYTPPKQGTKGSLGITPMVQMLRNADVIDVQLASGLRDVIAVANRAVHGESVSQENLERIIDLSLRVVRSLDTLVVEKGLSTMHARKVAKSQVRKKLKSQYEVITIVPFETKPEERTYTMNQAELDAFLEGYNEYSEFIVSVKEIEPPKKQTK